MNVDYNDVIKFKKEIEELYVYLKRTHENILNIIEDIECIDDDKFDTYYSYIKGYESKLDILKSDFFLLESENKKIKSCISQIKLLKKKRLTKINSNIIIENDINAGFDDMF